MCVHTPSKHTTNFYKTKTQSLVVTPASTIGLSSPSAQDTAYSIASPSARCSMADAKKTPAECYKLLQDGYIYIDVR